MKESATSMVIAPSLSMSVFSRSQVSDFPLMASKWKSLNVWWFPHHNFLLWVGCMWKFSNIGTNIWMGNILWPFFSYLQGFICPCDSGTASRFSFSGANRLWHQRDFREIEVFWRPVLPSYPYLLEGSCNGMSSRWWCRGKCTRTRVIFWWEMGCMSTKGTTFLKKSYIWSNDWWVSSRIWVISEALILEMNLFSIAQNASSTPVY